MTRPASTLAAFALLAGALLCASSPSRAQEGPPGPGGGPPPGEGRGPGPRPPPFEDLVERHAGRLGLDEAARAKIRAVVDGSRDEMRRLEEEMRTLRGELRDLLDADAPGVAEVLAKADAVGAAETAVHKLRLRTMLGVRALLTPDQRAELVKIHEEMRRERGRRSPPGGPPPPPPPRDEP